MFIIIEYSTVGHPEENFNGCGRHFFSMPDQEILKKTKDHNLILAAEKKKRRAVEDFKFVFQVIAQKLNRLIHEKNLDIVTAIKNFDRLNTGSTFIFMAHSYFFF